MAVVLVVVVVVALEVHFSSLAACSQFRVSQSCLCLSNPSEQRLAASHHPH